MNIQTVAASGLSFEVATAGKAGAEPVLLLHGFPQSAHAWRDQLPVLARHGYFAMAPNQRGYSPGARPAGAEHYTSDALMADALAIARHFGYASVHLVGHDWGGQLAWLIAALHPERVRTLSVLSRPHPRAFLDAMQADAAQAGRSTHHRAFQAADAADRMLADGSKRLREALLQQGVAAHDVDAYLGPLSTRAAMDAAINWYRAPGSDIARDLPPIERPTLYVWGDADATVGRPAASGTGAHVQAPYAFIELAGVGHFVTDQAAADVNRALLDHLGAQR